MCGTDRYRAHLHRGPAAVHGSAMTRLGWSVRRRYRAGMRAAALAFAFLAELAMLVAFAVWGFTVGSGIWAVVLGLGAPALVAAIWGVFCAPRSPRRLQDPALVAVQAALFSLAVVALISIGHPYWALILGFAALHLPLVRTPSIR